MTNHSKQKLVIEKTGHSAVNHTVNLDSGPLAEVFHRVHSNADASNYVETREAH